MLISSNVGLRQLNNCSFGLLLTGCTTSVATTATTSVTTSVATTATTLTITTASAEATATAATSVTSFGAGVVLLLGLLEPDGVLGKGGSDVLGSGPEIGRQELVGVPDSIEASLDEVLGGTGHTG